MAGVPAGLSFATIYWQGVSTMTNTIRIGVIGAGSISESHLKSYLKNPNAEIYAICDLNEQRARAKADKYDIAHVYTDYLELLANPEIDAVSICTWNNSHAAISIAAMNAASTCCARSRCAGRSKRRFKWSRPWGRAAETCRSSFVRGTARIRGSSRKWRITASWARSTTRGRPVSGSSATPGAGSPIWSDPAAVL